jgi:YidC/Oxa1 family membrane protein insertase
MNDIRRSVLWAVFLLSLFMIWDAWNKHIGNPSFFVSRSAAVVAQGASAPASAAALRGQAQAGEKNDISQASIPAENSALVSELVTIQTDVYKATFDTKGATLVYLELLQHVDQQDRSRNIVLFDRHAQHVYIAQTGLIRGAEGDPQSSLPTHQTIFKLVSTDRNLDEGRDELKLDFAASNDTGVTLHKRFIFKRGSYLIDVQHEISNSSASEVKPRLYVQLVRDGTVKGNTNMFSGPVSYTGAAFYTEASKFKKVNFSDIDKGKADFVKQADDGWVSMIQHYFVSAWLDTHSGSREFFARHLDNNLYAVGMIEPMPVVAPGSSSVLNQQLFAGPQEEKKLEKIAPGLDSVKDYGIFAIIAKPLFWLLDKIHSVLKNWGWSIVALVVMLKAAFFSLNASAYKSMAKMKAINPSIQALRERLKDNPQQLQQEMMNIYRKEKVNPLGGCLPILIQMPVFFALYWVLLSTVEMRNAPWIGWVHDLSVPDPLFILPVMMTLSTLLQTWLNPTPPDPVQAKMMWIMPLIFSVMFFFFPAGLVLYWVTNNLLSILQQYLINKKINPQV